MEEQSWRKGNRQKNVDPENYGCQWIQKNPLLFLNTTLPPVSKFSPP